ncbi:MAG TPA: zinc ribbon domain-containing protein [Vicinamibacterales bacterium]|nr:zinc ribbon domain-containing protein [Vicinamibacterales bacterium]
MQCKTCGTEIADKALICYKCGAPTTDAKYQPAEIRTRGRSRSGMLASVLALAFLVLMALYMGRASAADTPRYVTWIGVAIAVVVVGLRAYARRR